MLHHQTAPPTPTPPLPPTTIANPTTPETCCHSTTDTDMITPQPRLARTTRKRLRTLPPAPKSDPNSKLIEAPGLKGVVMEVRPDKSRRLIIATEVCLREGALEVLLCKKGTKEHEAILRVDVDAQELHKLLLLAGAEAGKPTQFVDPKTEQPAYKPATGTKINLTVHYTKDGKTFTHPIQDWVWDTKKKAALGYSWVFAGSIIIEDPDTGKKFYGANSGDIISISNFPYAMLEILSEISKDDAQLSFEAKTDKIPPISSKVWLIMEPVIEKKK
ncbi:MAG: YdjY domain-containing protein [Gemmataceae bacterium]